MAPAEAVTPLRALLAERGMTQRELAARCGLTPAAVCRYCSGAREPRSAAAGAMAAELGVAVDELLGLPAREGGDLAAAVALVCSRAASLDAAQRLALLEALAGL